MKRWLLSVGALLLLCQCASKDEALKPIEGSEESKEGATYLVGIIDFVNPEQRFVLFKVQPGISLPTGHTLTALDATGALSELVVTPERKDGHVSADIKSGSPRAGNLVVYYPARQANPAAALPATATPPLPGAPPSPSSFPIPAPLGSPADVEWREGQPPPRPLPQPIPGADAPIPLSPIPEEPPSSLPPAVSPPD
jgi:hypothetical protein